MPDIEDLDYKELSAEHCIQYILDNRNCPLCGSFLPQPTGYSIRCQNLNENCWFELHSSAGYLINIIIANELDGRISIPVIDIADIPMPKIEIYKGEKIIFEQDIKSIKDVIDVSIKIYNNYILM